MNKNKSKSVAVIAAHPDDEVLGCGGTMARHAKDGDEVHAYIMAEGLTSRDKKRNPDKRAGELCELSKAAHQANKLLGVKSLKIDNLPDNRLDSIDRLDLIKKVESFIDKVKPDIIYTHHFGDLNIDHRRVDEAVVTACRPMPGCQIQTLLFFEVPSSTDWQTHSAYTAFVPNWYIDISDTLNLKQKALSIYKSEVRDWPHSRSVEGVGHLSRWRGASVGHEAVEAFVLGRKII